MDPVNLGRKYDSPCCTPEVAKSDKDAHVSFPSVYLENLPSGVAIPKRGRITFEYELNSISERVKDEKTCYNLDLLQLVSAEGKGGPKKAESGEDVFKKFEAKIKGDEKSDDDESSDRDEYVAE